MAPRVLVIDDSPMTVQLLSQAISAAGLGVDTATDLASLDKHLDAHTYALVLVDVNMPEMYGDDVVEFLRIQRKLSARLYLYSDLPEEELAAKTKAAGADGYISKSHGLEAAVESIRQAAVGNGPQKLLVIDAAGATAKALADGVAEAGHEVANAHSVDDATKIILKKKARPTLVLLDLRTPGADAAALCRFVKGNTVFAGIRVLLCSTDDQATLDRAVVAAGADGGVRVDEAFAGAVLSFVP
ncbi:MAG: response regulator [Archangium sp.]|nr:response regulator [Archangium sp.]